MGDTSVRTVPPGVSQDVFRAVMSPSSPSVPALDWNE
jgi:hypothetical protein